MFKGRAPASEMRDVAGLDVEGPRCDRILAGMTFAVILAALFNVIAKGGVP